MWKSIALYGVLVSFCALMYVLNDQTTDRNHELMQLKTDQARDQHTISRRNMALGISESPESNIEDKMKQREREIADIESLKNESRKEADEFVNDGKSTISKEMGAYAEKYK